MDDVTTTLRISAAGMRTQGTRLRVIAENIANAVLLPAHRATCRTAGAW